MERRFGEFLRHLRETRHLTLREVEESAKVSNAYLSQIERGERGIPTLKVLRRLAEAYGVPVTELVRVAEPKTGGCPSRLESAAPDTQFISRGYEKLSKKNKEHLTAFLQHLIREEEGK